MQLKGEILYYECLAGSSVVWSHLVSFLNPVNELMDVSLKRTDENITMKHI